MTRNNQSIEALKDFKKAYLEIIANWETDDEVLESEEALNNYPFAEYFNEIEVAEWVDSILGQVYANELEEDEENLSGVDLKLRALKNLKKAYLELLECVEDGDILLDSNEAVENYPFESSIEELGLVEWVDAILEAFE